MADRALERGMVRLDLPAQQRPEPREQGLVAAHVEVEEPARQRIVHPLAPVRQLERAVLGRPQHPVAEQVERRRREHVGAQPERRGRLLAGEARPLAHELVEAAVPQREEHLRVDPARRQRQPLRARREVDRARQLGRSQQVLRHARGYHRHHRGWARRRLPVPCVQRGPTRRRPSRRRHGHLTMRCRRARAPDSDGAGPARASWWLHPARDRAWRRRRSS